MSDEIKHLMDYLKGAEDEKTRARELVEFHPWDVVPKLSEEERERVQDSDYATIDAVLARGIDELATIQSIHETDPGEVPSWDLHVSPKLCPKDWLVHCSDEDFCSFDIGSEMDKLALTTHAFHSWEMPGYNFAYEPESFERYGVVHGGCRYGKHVYLLKAPYVLTWHISDKEPQAIFWGPDATHVERLYFDNGEFTADNPAFDYDREMALEDEAEENDEEYEGEPEELTADTVEELTEMLDAAYKRLEEREAEDAESA